MADPNTDGLKTGLPAVLRESTRVVQRYVLLSAILANFACVLLLVLVVAPSGVLQAVARESSGWLSGTLLANVSMFALVVGIVLCAWGRLGLAAIGLRSADVIPAMRLLLGFWLLLNVVAALWQLAVHGELTWGGDWREGGYSRVLGRLLGQLAGNALYEEVLYRAVLLRQLFWHIARTRNARHALILALVISQALFALAHCATFLVESEPLLPVVIRALAVFCAGCAFAWLYLTTGKLLIAVAVHALVNAPSLLVTDPFGYDNLPLLLVLCLLARLLAAPSSTGVLTLCDAGRTP